MTRTRERCDELAAQGFMVILPDYFRGDVPEECGPGDFACWGGTLETPNLGSLSYHANNRNYPLHPSSLGAHHGGKHELDEIGSRLEPGQVLGGREGGHHLCCCW